jgi:hypothetical protein
MRLYWLCYCGDGDNGDDHVQFFWVQRLTKEYDANKGVVMTNSWLYGFAMFLHQVLFEFKSFYADETY